MDKGGNIKRKVVQNSNGKLKTGSDSQGEIKEKCKFSQTSFRVKTSTVRPDSQKYLAEQSNHVLPTLPGSSLQQLSLQYEKEIQRPEPSRVNVNPKSSHIQIPFDVGTKCLVCLPGQTKDGSVNVAPAVVAEIRGATIRLIHSYNKRQVGSELQHVLLVNIADLYYTTEQLIREHPDCILDPNFMAASSISGTNKSQSPICLVESPKMLENAVDGFAECDDNMASESPLNLVVTSTEQTGDEQSSPCAKDKQTGNHILARDVYKKKITEIYDSPAELLVINGIKQNLLRMVDDATRKCKGSNQQINIDNVMGNLVNSINQWYMADGKPWKDDCTRLRGKFINSEEYSLVNEKLGDFKDLAVGATKNTRRCFVCEETTEGRHIVTMARGTMCTHVRTHLTNFNFVYRCGELELGSTTECGMVFLDVIPLESHLKSVHKFKSADLKNRVFRPVEATEEEMADLRKHGHKTYRSRKRDQQDSDIDEEDHDKNEPEPRMDEQTPWVGRLRRGGPRKKQKS